MNQDRPNAADTLVVDDSETQLATTANSLIEEISAAYLGRQPNADNREHLRVKYTGQVRVCPSNSQGVPVGPSVMTSGYDLSLWGIAVRSPQSFEVDTPLTMELVIPVGENGRQVTMLATVRHVDIKDEDGQMLVGCQFLDTLIP